MGTTWRIVAVPVPSSLDDDEAWPLRALAELDRVVNDATWGHHDLAYPASESLAKLRDQQYTRRLHLVAVGPDRPRDVLGAALLRLPRRGNTHLLEVDVLVHPDHVGRGIDDALLRAAQELALTDGRRVVILSSEHAREPAADDPEALVAPTGSGRISRADPGARLAERSGYTLEQAERYSVLPLPVAPERLAELREAAAAAAGADYRTLTWTDRCPDAWVEGLARLESLMNTDAPVAGLKIVEDPWDAARIRAAETATAQAGRGSLTTAVEHVPTRTLAAFTTMEYPRASPELVFQHDTLVVREHRGRRLGLLVKTVNLEQLAALRPGARRLHTWNAEENAHMLAINIALGFEPAGVYGMWQKSLT